jgi:hypothetical protein
MVHTNLSERVVDVQILITIAAHTNMLIAQRHIDMRLSINIYGCGVNLIF